MAIVLALETRREALASAIGAYMFMFVELIIIIVLVAVVVIAIRPPRK